MRLSDRLGGHLVSGHVDATGTVVRFEPIGESFKLIIQAPQSILRYLTHKGSITVNGVSLTVNQIEDNEFSVNLIPHTLAMTTLKELCPGMACKPGNRYAGAICGKTTKYLRLTGIKQT